MLFQRRFYLSLILCVQCAVASAQRERETNEGDAELPPSQGAISFASFRNEPASDETAELEARVQRLEAELSQRNAPTYADPMRTLESQLQRQDAGSGALYGEIEVTFLQPHVSGSQAAFGLGAVGRLIDSEYQTGMRYILGYRNDSGVGVRGRFWQYDHNFVYLPPFEPAVFGIRMDVADTEITLDQRLRHWDTQVSGGIRYGRLQYSNSTPTLFGVGSATFEGVGPTFAVNGHRRIGNSGFSFFGNVRGSVLIGDIRNSALLPFMPAVTLEDEVMTVAENQLGVTWTHDLNQFVQLDVKTAWETQYWMNSTLSDDVYGIGSNLGFTGPTVSVELRY
ncbi:MAG: Lpg1974 family pore-forming outer membrane protein [Planctomycetaceae bacterium]